MVGLVAGYAAVWFAARPAGQPTVSYVGQFLGAEAVLLLSIGLVLISTLPWVETWFDGIDHAAIWHRRGARRALRLPGPPSPPSGSPRTHRPGVPPARGGRGGRCSPSPGGPLPPGAAPRAPAPP